jgi:hypothetical protein
MSTRPSAATASAEMEACVAHAHHVGGFLTRATPWQPTALTAYCHLIERAAYWQSEAVTQELLGLASREAPHSPPLTEFQEGVLEARRQFAAQGQS